MGHVYLTAAQPQFVFLSESEIWQSLHTENEVSAEVERLARLFHKRFLEYTENTQRHHLPAQVMQVVTRCPIERVAVQIMADMCAAGVELVIVDIRKNPDG